MQQIDVNVVGRVPLVQVLCGLAEDSVHMSSDLFQVRSRRGGHSSKPAEHAVQEALDGCASWIRDCSYAWPSSRVALQTVELLDNEFFGNWTGVVPL